MNVTGKKMFVRVGTNVEYAPYIEHGFTMSTGHVVFFDKVGFRYVHPFTYAGAHMFERAIPRLQEVLPEIIARHLLKASGETGVG
jgi:hypothetical protein